MEDYRGLDNQPKPPAEDGDTTPKAALETFRDVIVLWPDNHALADDCGVLPQHVAGWVQRDRIPGWHWQAVIEAAARRKIKGITAKLLAEIAAR